MQWPNLLHDESVEASMIIASPVAFNTAEREYNEAWNAPSNTRFELPPLDVNTVLKKRYRVSPETPSPRDTASEDAPGVLPERASHPQVPFAGRGPLPHTACK